MPSTTRRRQGALRGTSRTSLSISNAEIADRLASVAQLLSTQKTNPYKVRAYRRAASSIRGLSASVEELVRTDADLTRLEGIGAAIAGAIREIVLTGSLGTLDKLRTDASPEIASLAGYPRLDPKRVLRIYKKLKISSVPELREALESGGIERVLGSRIAQHVRQGLSTTRGLLMPEADDLRVAIEEFLINKCGVRRATVVGAYRRRVEITEEMVFVVETDDLPFVVSKLERFGGRMPLVTSSEDTAVFELPVGIPLRIKSGSARDWGRTLVDCTGSAAHLRNLAIFTESLPSVRTHGPFRTETALYQHFGLQYIRTGAPRRARRSRARRVR